MTQTLLWGSESWLLTKSEKRLLATTQNRMLRRIAGPGRGPTEEWVEWVKRSTRVARQAARQTKIRFWLEAHLRSKWCWAGHVQRMCSERLAKRALTWRDSQWQANEVATLPTSMLTRRPCRKRWFRWEDELRRYCIHVGVPCWQDLAVQRDSNGSASEWLSHCSDFVKCSK